MNQFQLSAVLFERDMVRYTPAGVPIVTFKLAHTSTQMEASFSRQVVCDVEALSAGESAQRVTQLALDKMYHFTGFIAHKGRNSKRLIFHVTAVTTYEAITT